MSDENMLEILWEIYRKIDRISYRLGIVEDKIRDIQKQPEKSE